jgi:hypothetical protein
MEQREELIRHKKQKLKRRRGKDIGGRVRNEGRD